MVTFLDLSRSLSCVLKWGHTGCGADDRNSGAKIAVTAYRPLIRSFLCTRLHPNSTFVEAVDCTYSATSGYLNIQVFQDQMLNSGPGPYRCLNPTKVFALILIFDKKL